MDEKTRFWLRGLLFGLVALTILAWALFSFAGGNTLPSLLMLVVLALVVAFGVKFLKLNYERIGKGIPQQDEFSKNVMRKAGYYTFLVSIYVLLGLGFYSGTMVEEWGYPPILARHVAFLAIAIMALVFGALYFYFSMKGDAE